MASIVYGVEYSMRIRDHPILGRLPKRREVTINVDGRPVKALNGETIASALLASGVKVFRMTKKRGEPRGYFCGIGLCTDCVMIVNGVPNIRTCITLVEDGMKIETQTGVGES